MRRRRARARHDDHGPYARAALLPRPQRRHRARPRRLQLSRHAGRGPRQEAAAPLQRPLRRNRPVGRRSVAARLRPHRSLGRLSGAVPMTTSLLDELPAIPRDAEGPVFREPWEAQAFALVVKLHEQGHFTWPEWAALLAEEIAAAQRRGEVDLGTTYYRH